MAKTFKAMWLGDGDPQSQVIEEGGIRFVKGEAVTVPQDLKHNGMWWADIIKDNPTFAIDDTDEDPVDAGEEAERKALTDKLDAANIKHPAKASVEALRKLLPAAA